MSDGISTAFVGLCQLADHMGASPLNALPGCWEHKIDDDWWVALNAHPVPHKCSQAELVIDPFQAVIFWKGWPAGVIGPYGGALMAAEDGGEAGLITAIEKRLGRKIEENPNG